MANQFNASTNAKIQTLFNSIRSALNNLDMDFADAPAGMSVTITVDDTGLNVSVTTKPGSAGLNNRFGPADGGPAGRLTRVPAKIINVSSLP